MPQSRGSHADLSLRPPNAIDVFISVVTSLTLAGASQLFPLAFFDGWSIFWLSFGASTFHSLLNEKDWPLLPGIVVSVLVGAITMAIMTSVANSLPPINI